MACPHCSSATLVTIGMHVKGDEVTMCACAGCEQRWWLRGDDRLSLNEVLTLATA